MWLIEGSVGKHFYNLQKCRFCPFCRIVAGCMLLRECHRRKKHEMSGAPVPRTSVKFIAEPTQHIRGILDGNAPAVRRRTLTFWPESNASLLPASVTVVLPGVPNVMAVVSAVNAVST